ncbi:MAG: hypothetical protein KDK41_14660 [Leptospiraceae bacterium]|nr:hypothetical protein [Leptospiraceae bacterium]
MKKINEQEKNYFSQQGLADLKSDIELVFAIGTEIKLLKKGKRFYGRCPMCDYEKHSLEPVCEAAAYSKLHSESFEQKLSLVISPKKNLWFCFGDCKKGGSIVDWVMSYEKLKLIEALAVLAERYPFLAQKGQLGKLGLNEAMPEYRHLPAHQPILQKIINHYHSCLYKTPVTEGIQSRVIRYLRSLGISHRALKSHKIGFCDSSLVRGFLEKVTNNLDSLVDEEIQYLEMLPSTQEMYAPVREFFDGQIVFPVFDTSRSHGLQPAFGNGTGENGHCLQLLGRKIPERIQIAQVSLVVN